MSKLPTFSGNIVEAGTQYAEFYERDLASFFTQEFSKHKFSKKYVQQCTEACEKFAPNFVKFVTGMLKKSPLSREQHILLSLHEEELYHRPVSTIRQPHCSLVGVSNSINGGAILAQNWDWGTQYAPYTSINRFIFKNGLRLVTVSYPGMPLCSGLNSKGLSVQLTGTGYYPLVIPKSGVPTYASIFELMLQNDVRSAVKYLKSVPNAGCFAIVLADRSGKVTLAESVPGKVFFQEVDVVSRSNVFELPESIKISKQIIPKRVADCHSIIRNKVFKKSLGELAVTRTVSQAVALLSDGKIYQDDVDHATLIQVAADCRNGRLYFKEWKQRSNKMQRVKV